MNATDLLKGSGSGLFLSDGGLETDIIFHDGIDLPNFASFVLLDSDDGRDALQRYYRRYIDIAKNTGHGFVLETPTWRANLGWADAMGLDREQMIDVNRRGLEFVQAIREEYADSDVPFIVSGNIGPAADGYVTGETLSIEEAAELHAMQIGAFAAHGADLVTAITMTYADEASGIVQAAKAAGIPSVIGFTTETDGRLPSGQTLQAAIEQVDAATDGGPLYYMVNCAHTDHFSDSLEDGSEWMQRIRALRSNASRLSHAELDESETLDDGDPREFGELYKGLRERFPDLLVFGGCCGTDHRHIAATAESLAA